MSQRRKINKGRGKRRVKGSSTAIQRFGTVQTSPTGPLIVSYPGFYMPPKFCNHMRYSETWNVTTAGGIQAYDYKMNSIYDPYVGAGGNGVYGIDQMSAIYNRYRVVKAHIVVTANTQSGAETTQLYLYANGDSTSANLSRAESAPNVRHAQLTQQWPNMLELVTTPGTWLQGPQDRDLSAVISADPTALAYFHILMQNFSLGALNVVIRVMIDFTVEWSGLNSVDDVDA